MSATGSLTERDYLLHHHGIFDSYLHESLCPESSATYFLYPNALVLLCQNALTLAGLS